MALVAFTSCSRANTVILFFYLQLQTANGQVEAKVSCFYRRRDLSNALVSQADKHASKCLYINQFADFEGSSLRSISVLKS